ncbi:thermonuclease family protein [Geobacillus stearothermophilus]|uniref:thermonuclease family protein n=1 Tax=Geobacillus TaxID=129337 RepID=UPI0009B88C33|nr:MULTISPECIES: thermonuclease family protein [Geobacillus]MED3721262.1 thermonuclease family protein [Geobacillus stearothermophilus]MED4333556.1 thermonuclease family protein [Geobacillus stearothermophilus]OQP11139.1 nuclease [Geobacillus thermoleovorans]
MKGCLTVILLILLIALVVNYPFFTIGIALAIWGIYEWKINKNLGAKSKKPAIILSIGLILALGSCVGNDDVTTEKEVAIKQEDGKVLSDESKKEKDKKQEEKKDDNKQVEGTVNEEKSESTAATGENQNSEQKESNAEAQKQAQLSSLIKKFGLQAAIVSRVVDGDTFELSDGRKVRLIGINTPESTTRTEEYGKEASNYTKSKLEGKRVYLQKDVSETDQYGRLLRIVWLSVPTNDMNENEIRSKMFNANLVINGYAEPSTYPPDVKYADYFRKFAREAREANRGLWAYGEYGTTKGDFDPKETERKSSNSSTNRSSGSSSSSNAKSSSSSSATSPSSRSEEYFKNCTELRKVYPNGVPADHPAYQPRLDRDKDNYACER